MVKKRKTNWHHRTWGDRFPEFFKIYFPNQSSQRLRIPPAFIKNFNGVVPNKIVLKYGGRESYDVTVKKNENNFFLEDGWKDFVDDHLISPGDFLIFKNNRPNIFEVKIFGTDACKKEEGAIGKKRSNSQEAVDDNTRVKKIELEEANAKEKQIFVETEVTSESEEEEEEEEEENAETESEKSEEEEEEEDDDDDDEDIDEVQVYENGKWVAQRNFNAVDQPGTTESWVPPRWYHRSIKAATVTDEEYKLIEAAGLVVPKFPHFLGTIYAHKTRHYVTLPKYLLVKHSIVMKHNVVFRDRKGNRWPIKVRFSSDGRTELTQWKTFYEENNMCPKDKCLIELVLDSKNQCNKIILQIFRAKDAHA
ncbi:B3 DNA binding domain [Dillenia turbinata]|uniref:B3 DNA binding domain n=1 Tax=Dillenia turbinata TaxID=194707 RepID=A0AAN8USS6_9MAGN